MTTEEAAEYMRLASADALLSLRHRGAAPPAAKVGRNLLWERSAVDEWVAERTTARPEPTVAR